MRKHLWTRRWLAWLALLCLVCPLAVTASASPAASTAGAEGYHAVAAWDMDFLAVGDGGRVTVLSVDGAHRELPPPVSTPLRDVAVVGGTAWIVGDAGVVLAYDGAAFRPAPMEDTVDLYAVTSFGSELFLGGSGGTLYRGSGDGVWTRESLPLAGDIVGLAAGASRLIGVTSAGETFTYTAKEGFTAKNYNDETGDTVAFRDVACDNAGLTFWATGVRADGSPAVLHTTYGGIWGERSLQYMDGAGYDPSGLAVFGLAAAGDQMVAACGEGQLLTLPDCVECNKLQRRAEAEGATLTAVCYNGGVIAAVGETFAVALADDEEVRQYKVTAATARQLQQEGAVIIDVRDVADYTARHIAGSLCIPLGELETLLPKLVPDCETTVIFYCTKGVRSQTAVERAWGMEYYHAFSLGGIDNWTYEFETGAPVYPEEPDEPDPPVLLGDVNGDGRVDTGDARLLLQVAAEIISLDDIIADAADVNGDGSIDTGDARLLLQYAAEIITEFPAQA